MSWRIWEEHLSGIPIETTRRVLERECRRAHEAWFAEPHSAERRAEFAAQLSYLARETRNKAMLAHAMRIAGGDYSTGMPMASPYSVDA